jgi:hypothetical protein
MRSPALSVFFGSLMAASLCGGPAPSLSQAMPSLHKGRVEMALDPPVYFPKKVALPSQLQDQATELAELSAGIPERIKQVNHGQLPKELNKDLKRIEKLAKQLRSEVAP